MFWTELNLNHIRAKHLSFKTQTFSSPCPRKGYLFIPNVCANLEIFWQATATAGNKEQFPEYQSASDYINLADKYSLFILAIFSTEIFFGH